MGTNLHYRHNKLRRTIIKLLGGKCIECGYDKHEIALQIDHVHEDGRRDRERYNRNEYLKQVLISIVYLKDGRYQLLCANCNIIKHYEYRMHLRSSHTKHTTREWRIHNSI